MFEHVLRGDDYYDGIRAGIALFRGVPYSFRDLGCGWIDYRLGTRDSKPAVEFSWEGRNDADPTCGRGWATIDDDRIIGRLFFHNGDDSAFIAVRESRARGTTGFRATGA